LLKCAKKNKTQVEQGQRKAWRISSPKYVTKYVPIKVITKLPNSEQSYKGKVKTHNYINRENQSTTGKL
jgi:hypothetical protein